MIDPITAFSAATAAYSGIKKAISVGQDITSMGSTLSQWSKAVSDLDFLDQKAQKPPIYKMFSNTESDALEIWTKKQKIKEMRDELRSFISWNYHNINWRCYICFDCLLSWKEPRKVVVVFGSKKKQMGRL